MSEGGQDRPLEFSTYVMSLATSALVQLGEAPDPETGQETQADMGAARQTIDILGVLQEKTAGNLDDAEERLLRNLIRDLRFRFVSAAKRNATDGGG
jgi:hypothetical protein